jgi:hypothetical protein
MAHQIFRLPKATAISDNLTLVAGAKVSFFLTGTSTPTDTYQDSALTTPHTNPVIADAAGRFPPIYLNPDILYRVTFTDSADVEIYPAVDPVNDRVLSQAIIGGYLYPRTAAEIATVVTPVNFSRNPDAPGDVRRFGTTGDGVADDTAELQAAFDAATVSGEKLLIVAGTYGISSTLTIDGKINIEMAAGAQIKALASFPNPASVDDASWMIDADNAAVAGSRFRGINLHGNEVAKGLRVKGTTDVQVLSGKYTKMRGPGVYFEDMKHAVAAYNFMDECGVDSGGSTGVFTTSLRCQGNSLTAEQILFHGNIINNSGGKGIAFSTSTRCIASDNFVKDCVAGHGACFYVAASSHVVFRGNLGYGSVTGSAEIIKLSTTANFCTAESNYFIQTIDQDICVIEDASFLTIQGNTFVKVNAPSASEQAIKLNDSSTNSTNLLIKNNAFYGHDISVGTAIAAPATVANVTVIGNHFENWSTGLQIVGASPIVRTNSYRSVTTPEQLAGASTPTADYSALILRTASDQVATGPGAGSLSLTLPAARMDRTRGIRVKGSGTKTGSAGNKTIAFRFGSTDFTFNADANDTNSWYFEAEVLNVSETSQRVQGVGFNGATALPFIGTAAEDTATALDVGVRATPAGADTVTLKMLTVELLP